MYNNIIIGMRNAKNRNRTQGTRKNTVGKMYVLKVFFILFFIYIFPLDTRASLRDVANNSTLCVIPLAIYNKLKRIHINYIRHVRNR